MDIRQGHLVSRLLHLCHSLNDAFHFLCVAGAFAGLLALANCASPGEPIERKPEIAEPISDLTAQQVGNAVSLTFTLPEETVDRRALAQPLTVEIYRDFVSAASAANGNSASTTAPAAAEAPTALRVTIPAANTSNYVMQGRFQYTDELQAGDFSQNPNRVAVYAVRTRASVKRDSADSNVVSLIIRPLPDPIDDLKAEVTHSGIQLRWTPPTKTPVGAVPPVISYRIYRSQGQGISPEQSGGAALTKIGESQTANYLDSEIQFGSSYAYSVRSVVRVDGKELESGESNSAAIVARDTFPPATPQGLVVVAVPARAGNPANLELSWNISVETDLAGYNVYRSEQSGVQGTRLNQDLLPAPAFQDVNVVAGRTYFYTVTAVDRSGNESPGSSAVSGALPAESQALP